MVGLSANYQENNGSFSQEQKNLAYRVSFKIDLDFLLELCRYSAMSNRRKFEKNLFDVVAGQQQITGNNKVQIPNTERSYGVLHQDMTWWQDIAHDMQELEELLPLVVTTSEQGVQAASRMIFAAGGKRLRPAFAFLCGRINGCSGERMMPLAIALELMHTGSLIHDDIIDGALLRRGHPTINAVYGNKLAVHTGNYLVAKALSLVNGYEDPRMVDALNRIVDRMVQGEFQQISMAWQSNQRLRHYLYRTRRKTALLLAISCETGAYAAGIEEPEAAALRRYGYYLGMAFQITDDIMDLVGTEESIGKPVGSDLRQGNFTLPLLYALRGPAEEKLLPLIRNAAAVNAHFEEIVALVEESGGIRYSRELADRYVEKALLQMEFLPEGEPVESLRSIAGFIARREY